MGAGWLARRRLSRASKPFPKMRIASASPERTASSADASEGMKTERKNSACFVAKASLFLSCS